MSKNAIALSPGLSSYLRSTTELADVLAALQAMARYKYYQLDFKEWSYRITGSHDNDDHWRSVISRHPEFFRIDADGNAALVARRQHRKLYDVDRGIEISTSEFQELKKQGGIDRISRRPLSETEIETLIRTAVELHTRAVAENTDKRWWIPVLGFAVNALAALGGALIGVLLVKG